MSAGKNSGGRVVQSLLRLTLLNQPQQRLADSTRQESFSLRLILLLADLLAIAFAGERFFDALLLPWFQIKRVTLDLFDNVLGLNFALETAQGILERFTFLDSNLCHSKKHLAIGPERLSIQNTPSEQESMIISPDFIGSGLDRRFAPPVHPSAQPQVGQSRRRTRKITP
jgi:hypothetical protein